MDKLFLLIDSFLEKAEERFGKLVISLIIGCFFILLAGLISASRFETFYHGNGFTRLSLHPFETQSENDLRYRILSPLLGYLVYMRGPLFKYFMLAVLAIFYALVYFFQRRSRLRPSEALGITAVLALSTLTFHQLYFPAYTDPLSYVLIFLFMIFHRRKILSTILLSLMLFNHENTIFLFPFFFLLSANGNFKPYNLYKILLQLIVAFVPYLLYRKIISSYAEIGFSISYYFDPVNMQWTREHVLPHLIPGIFQAFRLTWIFLIGAIVIDVYQKRFLEIVLMLSIPFFVFLQFFIAYDISRLAGLAFPVLIISLLRIREFIGTKKILTMILAVIILNFFIPSYYIGALEPILLTPAWFK